MDISNLDLPGFFERGGLTLRQMEHEPVPFAVFDHAVPTAREVRLILECGYGLHLVNVPPDSLDLRFLEQFAVGLEHLGIADFDCRDVGAIQSLSGLKTLSLNMRQERPVDLSGLSRLRSYDGPLHHFESVLQAPELKHLSLRDVRDGKLDVIPRSLESLTLVDAQGLRALPETHDSLPALRELHVNGIREFDLGSLTSYRLLEIVGLGKARSITSAEALLELPRLRTLAFDGCHCVEPIESLLRLGPVEVSVLGRNPFDSDFRASAELAVAKWTYYGTARRPRS